jgi:hypothetical protein
VAVVAAAVVAVAVVAVAAVLTASAAARQMAADRGSRRTVKPLTILFIAGCPSWSLSQAHRGLT